MNFVEQLIQFPSRHVLIISLHFPAFKSMSQAGAAFQKSPSHWSVRNWPRPLQTSTVNFKYRLSSSVTVLWLALLGSVLCVCHDHNKGPAWIEPFDYISSKWMRENSPIELDVSVQSKSFLARRLRSYWPSSPLSIVSIDRLWSNRIVINVTGFWKNRGLLLLSSLSVW